MPKIFRNLSRKKKATGSSQSPGPGLPGSIDTAGPEQTPLQPHSTAKLTSPATVPLETGQISVGVAQSVGVQRDNNEDSLYTLTSNVLSNGQVLKFGLYIIADGMGGHDNGELASSLAVHILSEHVIKSVYLPALAGTTSQIDRSLQEILHEGVLKSHQAIKKDAFGGGTTLTALLVMGDVVTLSHVGDSRAYTLAPDEKLTLLTKDHSLVKRMEEIGQLSPEEAASHPRRNLLYRAVGQGDALEPDITSFPVVEGSSILLCSDGLWGVIDEGVLKDIFNTSTEPHIICQSLVNAANAAGGPDNISVILVRFLH